MDMVVAIHTYIYKEIINNLYAQFCFQHIRYVTTSLKILTYVQQWYSNNFIHKLYNY